MHWLPRVNRPQTTWDGRILTLHLNYVAAYTNPLLFLFERTQQLTLLTTKGKPCVIHTHTRSHSHTHKLKSMDRPVAMCVCVSVIICISLCLHLVSLVYVRVPACMSFDLCLFLGVCACLSFVRLFKGLGTVEPTVAQQQ